MFIVRMGVDGNTIDVTGRFDDVTGQNRVFSALYHKRKDVKCHLLLSKGIGNISTVHKKGQTFY